MDSMFSVDDKTSNEAEEYKNFVIELRLLEQERDQLLKEYSDKLNQRKLLRLNEGLASMA